MNAVAKKDRDFCYNSINVVKTNGKKVNFAGLELKISIN